MLLLLTAAAVALPFLMEKFSAQPLPMPVLIAGEREREMEMEVWKKARLKEEAETPTHILDTTTETPYIHR